MTETFKKHPLETGGILLGHVLDNGMWIVMEVLPPGWRSTFQYAYFEYDEEFVNYVAQNESRKYKQQLSVLGLWHRHPGSYDVFSGTDDGTNATFASLSTHGAISGLVNIDPRFRLTMYHCSYPLHYTRVDVEVGDDLIPEEYFELNYYDEGKETNPLPDDKKKELANIVNFSGNVSKEEKQTNTKANKNLYAYLSIAAFIIAIACLVMLYVLYFKTQLTCMKTLFLEGIIAMQTLLCLLLGLICFKKKK